MSDYVPIFYDWIEQTQELSAVEKGRLIDAIVLYARGGAWQEMINGNERYAFPFFRAQIDRAREKSEVAAQVHRECGKLGGRPRKNQNNQNGFPETKKTHNEYNYKYNYENNNDNGNGISAAVDASLDLNSLPAYASSNLQYLSPRNMEELLSFADDLPDDLIRYAIDQGCAAGKRTWAYVRAILNAYVQQGIKTVGEAKAKDDAHAQNGKQAAASRNNPALNYPQREYKPEDFGDNFFFDPLKAGYGGGA